MIEEVVFTSFHGSINSWEKDSRFYNFNVLWEPNSILYIQKLSYVLWRGENK